MVTTGAMLVGERRCGWLQCWLEVAALRAGISYLFGASLTILAFRMLGNSGRMWARLRAKRTLTFLA